MSKELDTTNMLKDDSHIDAVSQALKNLKAKENDKGKENTVEDEVANDDAQVTEETTVADDKGKELDEPNINKVKKEPEVITEASDDSVIVDEPAASVNKVSDEATNEDVQVAPEPPTTVKNTKDKTKGKNAEADKVTKNPEIDKQNTNDSKETEEVDSTFTYSISHIDKSKLHTKDDLFNEIEKHNGGKTKEDALFVANLNKAIASELGLGKEKQEEAYQTGKFYDVGMIGLKPDFVNFDGKYSKEMVNEMREHVKGGIELLEHVGAEPHIVEASTYHHRDFDGGGYGKEAKGKDIPELARITRVSDSIKGFDNKGNPPLNALDDIRNPRWGNPYDNDVVDAYEKVHTRIKENLAEKGINEPSLDDFKDSLDTIYIAEIENTKDKNPIDKDKGGPQVEEPESPVNSDKIDKENSKKKEEPALENDTQEAPTPKKTISSYQRLKGKNEALTDRINQAQENIARLQEEKKELNTTVLSHTKRISMYSEALDKSKEKIQQVQVGRALEVFTLKKEHGEEIVGLHKKHNEQLANAGEKIIQAKQERSNLNDMFRKFVNGELSPEEKVLIQEEFRLGEKGHKFDNSLSYEERASKVNNALLVEDARTKEERKAKWETKKSYLSAALKTTKDLITKPATLNERLTVPKDITAEEMKTSVKEDIKVDKETEKKSVSFISKVKQAVKKTVLHTNTVEKKEASSEKGWSVVVARATSNISNKLKKNFDKTFPGVSEKLTRKMSQAKRTFNKHLETSLNEKNLGTNEKSKDEELSR